MTGVAGVVIREMKSAEREMRLDAGVALADVESLGAVVDERY